MFACPAPTSLSADSEPPDFLRRLSSLPLFHARFGICWLHISLQKRDMALAWSQRILHPLAIVIGLELMSQSKPMSCYWDFPWGCWRGEKLPYWFPYLKLIKFGGIRKKEKLPSYFQISA